MITGRWGKPTEVLLDIEVESDGTVRGVANPGRQNAPIRRGRFDFATGEVVLEGEVVQRDGESVPFIVEGHLRMRTLVLAYRFGELRGAVELVRVEEYRPARRTVWDLAKYRLAAVRRRLHSLSRPSPAKNAARLRARRESLESVVFRDATPSDVQALSELHVATWNATYRTSRGPSVATRLAKWSKVFSASPRRDFVLVLENRDGQLIGFTWGRPSEGEFAGELSKIYLRWEYHGLGLGRRMMEETAQRFLARGIESFVLFAELTNPTLGFYDRMGGVRLLDERGMFCGAYAWNDPRALLPSAEGRDARVAAHAV